VQILDFSAPFVSGCIALRKKKKMKKYTVSHKNRATLFFIITQAFLGRFLYCLYHWKQEGILYKAAYKIYHFTLTVSLHYLVNLKRHINGTFWRQSSQCVRSSSPLNNFHRKSSNVRLFQFLVGNTFISLIVRKFWHSHRFLITILDQYLNSMYLILRSNCMK